MSHRIHTALAKAAEELELDEDAVAALAPEEVELEYSYGGKPSYWWLIAAE